MLGKRLRSHQPVVREDDEDVMTRVALVAHRVDDARHRPRRVFVELHQAAKLAEIAMVRRPRLAPDEAEHDGLVRRQSVAETRRFTAGVEGGGGHELERSRRHRVAALERREPIPKRLPS